MTQVAMAVGIDCGKDFLDVAVVPTGEHTRFDNTPAGHDTLVGWLHGRQVQLAGLEASGGCERAVRTRLVQAGLTVHVFDPARVRHFARASGCRAKDDPTDAAMIAAFTATFAPTLAPTVIDEPREALADLVRARQLLVGKRADLKKAAAQAGAVAKAAFDSVVAQMNGAIAALETAMADSL